MENSVIFRSGWLHRKLNLNETALRWDRSYVELYRDGYFKYYESDHSPNAEDCMYLPTECVAIKTGYQVEGRPKPPNGLSIQFLFSVTSINNKVWVFCCESMGELKAWQNNLEEARLSMFMKPGHYASASPLLLNQTLVRNPLIPTPFHPAQFNPMVLSQLPGYLPPTAGQTLAPHASGALPAQAYSSPLIAQHPLSFPMVPLMNSSSFSSPYAHPGMHPASNGLLLSTGQSHQLTGAQLSMAHHSAANSSPSSYPTQAVHHTPVASSLHHPATNSHHPATSHYPSSTLSNGMSSMSTSQPSYSASYSGSYSTSQPILPTALNPAAVQGMPAMYGRSDFGLLPHHQNHPLLRTPNSAVWW